MKEDRKIKNNIRLKLIYKMKGSDPILKESNSYLSKISSTAALYAGGCRNIL
jgi:hypothetical protein